MHTLANRIAPILFTIALVLCAGITHAQAVQVDASISPSAIYIGDSGVLEIAIAGAPESAAVDPPPAPVVPGLKIDFAGVTRTAAPVVIVNGQRRNMGPDRIVFQYQVTPQAAGRFTIPAIPVTVAGRTISTTPLTFTSGEPPEARDVTLALALAESTAYVGQPIAAQLTLSFTADLESARFSTNTQATGLEVFDAPNPAERTANRVIGVDLDGRKVRGALDQTTVDGAPGTVLSMAYTIIPDRAGTIDIPGPLAVVEVITGEDGFGLIRQNRTERRVARAKPISLEVKPLPAEGRPADFSGLIGTFDLSANATPTTVHIGEPINVRVSITGSEPLERAEPPDLGAIPAFASSFKLSPEGWAEDSAPSNMRARVFSTTIRATSDTLAEIPAIPLSYFDPATGKYRTVLSEPIPLDVQETRQITAADAIGSDLGSNGTHFPKIERVPLENASSGAVFAPIPKRLTSQHLLLTEQFRSPIIAGAIALPPLALAASAIFAIRRRTADPDGARRRGALRAAVRTLGAGATPESCSQAMRTFLADRFGLVRATITAHDARRLISPFDPVLADQAARALLAADANRFADAPTTRPFNPSEMRQLLTRLDEVTAS